MKPSDKPEPIEIYDTTLRDGTQREGISLTVLEKLAIAGLLDRFGVSFIEGGWPGSNPKDAEFFRGVRDREFLHAKVTAFGSTRRADIVPEDDANLRALLEAKTEVCTIFGKTWTLHVTEVLRCSLEENLRMIRESVAYLRSEGRRVIYDAEHFFDGYAADPEYALATLEAAAAGGAETLVLCDTNGGTLPFVVEDVVRAAGQRLGRPLGIHAHNDVACAVASSLAAVRAGATHVQGTINGYGERCGNADLCSVVPNLILKLGLGAGAVRDLSALENLSARVAELVSVPRDEHLAYVGRAAFAHKGGVHVAAMRRNGDSYQHIDPLLVGNVSRVLVSELSGRGNLLSKAEELGMGGLPNVEEALQLIKESEAKGFAYEGAEASVALLFRRRKSDYVPPFRVLEHQVMSGQRGGTAFSDATLKVMIGDQVMHTAAEGNGPVNALDAALRKALLPLYPEVDRMKLSDYKVRILDGAYGTGATTRVLIDMSIGNATWTSVGASANIIEASLAALVDGLEFGLQGETAA